MLAKALSAAVYGIDANLIDVEVDFSGIKLQDDRFYMVGLPDSAVRESRERVRAAADILRVSHIGPNFHGFVEGQDITAGTTDVVVTDGFTGNVALKTGEGALKLSGDLLRQIFRGSLTGKLAYLLVRPGLDRMRQWLDPRRYNGAVMLGLNGTVVKSHGGTDAEGFAHAVDVAMDMVTHGFNEKIRAGLGHIEQLGQLPLAAAV